MQEVEILTYTHYMYELSSSQTHRQTRHTHTHTSAKQQLTTCTTKHNICHLTFQTQVQSLVIRLVGLFYGLQLDCTNSSSITCVHQGQSSSSCKRQDGWNIPRQNCSSVFVNTSKQTKRNRELKTKREGKGEEGWERKSIERGRQQERECEEISLHDRK